MEKRDDFYIPEEVAEWIGLKKSEYLSKLIQLQTSEDIGFEEFHHYDVFVPSTIEGPDKTYQSVVDDQTIQTYIKTYQEKSGFHQVVVGVVVKDKRNTASVFVPIISFVSNKKELVREFCVGEAVSPPTLN